MSLHHLSAAAHHHPSATVPPQFQEPDPNTAVLHPPSSPATVADYHLLGFTKLPLPLPHSFTAASRPPLCRTISEPKHSSPPQLPEFPTSPALNQSRQMISNRNLVQEPIQFPNASTVLHRTVSDPNPQVAVATRPPLRPPAGRNASRSPTCGEGPSTKRLKRMSERLREMNQWWNQVVIEDDAEEENEKGNDCNFKEETENCTEIPSQEDVWIEKNGECLVLHFKCPCNKGYEVLLSGKNCYYKLTDF